jgi:hypothetical protein
MPGSSTTPGRPGARTHAPVRVAFRFRNGVSTRDMNLRSVNGLIITIPELSGFSLPLPDQRRPRSGRGRGRRLKLFALCKWDGGMKTLSSLPATLTPGLDQCLTAQGKQKMRSNRPIDQ